MASLLVFLGLCLGFLALFANQAGLGGREGFGWKQFLGILIGGAVAGFGAVLRVDAVGIAGTALVVVTMFADYLGGGKTEREFPVYLVVILIAALVFVRGLLVRRRDDKPI